MEIKEDLSLIINNEKLSASYRKLSEIRSVLYDDVKESSDDIVLYVMYRGFHLKKHEAIFNEKKLRFDITVMTGVNLGREPNKTLGHYHPISEDGLSYPEVYQVLYGRATYLLQRERDGEIIDFVVLNAKEGEAVLIPPNYGHVTVNSGGTILIMVNLVSNNFTPIYDDYVKRRGAAYYLLLDGSLIPNKNYKKLPSPRFSSKKFLISKDLYSDFISCPSYFDFLNSPSLIKTFII